MKDNEAVALGVMGIVFAIIAVVVLVIIVIGILYLMTLYKCLKKVKPENRAMEPGLVWLSLIPVFNLVWNFFIVIQMKESLSKEFNSRQLPDDGDYGFGMGLTFAILACVNNIPYLNVLTSIPTLIFWVIYWIKISGYSKQLDGAPAAAVMEVDVAAEPVEAEAAENTDGDFYR